MTGLPDAPTLPWEQPLGATVADGNVIYRTWAPAATAVEVETGGVRHPLAPAGLGVFETTLAGTHGDDYRFVLDGTAWPDPQLPLAARRHQGPVAGGRPRPLRSRRRAAHPRPGRPGDLRAARRHVHARGHLHRGDPPPARAGGARRHRHRADAGRRIAGPTRLGLRRRVPGRRAVELRRTRRVWPAWSTRPTAPASACCSTSSTTTSAHRARRPTTPSGPTSPTKYHTPWGRVAEPRRRRSPARCASGCSRAPSTGSATCTSTACGSTRSTRSSTPGHGTSWPSSPTACGPSTPARC